MMKHIADRSDEEPENHHTHNQDQPFVCACTGANTAQVEQGEQRGEEHDPSRIRNSRPDIVRSLTAPDSTNQGADEQGEHITPSSEETERRMHLTADISEYRTGARIGPR